MSSQEEKLISRIREVFDAHQDASANHGWAELRKRYPQRRRRPLLFWLSSAAAIGLLALGFWLYSPLEFSTPKKRIITSKRDSAPDYQNKSVNVPSSKSTTPQNSASSLSKGVENAPAHHIKPLGENVKKPQVRNRGVVSLTTGTKFAVSKKSTSKMKEMEKSGQQAIISKPLEENGVEVTQVPFTRAPDSGGAIPSSEKHLLPTTSTLTVAAKDSLLRQADAIQPSLKESPLSFFMSAFATYANESPAKINSGAGLSYDFPVASRLKLNVGFGLFRYSLAYNNGYSPLGTKDIFSSPSGIGVTSSVSASRALRTVEILTLDVPLNVKYTIAKRKNLYLISGFSSLVTLNEKYLFSPQGVSATSFSSLSPILETDNSFNPFNQFNISAGFSLNLSKNERLAFEPFAKLPLKTMGSKNISFSTVGVNVKLYFSKYVKAINTRN